MTLEKRGPVMCAMALAGLLLSSPLHAQETGAVSGTVVESATQQPVTDAQVFVEGTDIGTLTDDAGQYTIREVPAGSRTIVVQHIGHARATTNVQVQAGQSVTADFQLTTDAVQMEELVVTGAGVTQQKKQLGQTVGTINTDDFANAPASNVQDILDGRVAGLIANSMGETGSSASIRLRGTVSISQRNTPLLYVDGVRVPNQRGQFESIVTSTLNDIQPENIERIEVLKGAAAATLYGTEASAGVIQIYTKRGANTEPRWNLKIGQQLIQMPGAGQIPADRIPDNVVYNPETGGLESIEPERFFLRTGHRQDYNLSVRGGSSAMSYFGSAWYTDEKAPMPTNSLRNSGTRLGLDFSLTDKLRSQTSLSYIDNKIRAPSPSWGLMGEATLASPLVAEAQPEQRPYGGLFFSVPGALAFRNTQERDRILTDVQLTYDWTADLTSRATFGYNASAQKEVRFTEQGASLAAPSGLREIRERDGNVITVYFSTAWQTEITENLSSSFTVGAQGFWEESQEHNVLVQDFPAPGLKTLRGASSVSQVDEFALEEINAGIFGQEQIGLNDRLFLTLGLRLDGSSAFGEAFGVQPYPKAGLSWVVSEEPFWESETLNHLRLRAAYGTSGLQPGAFDALRTWRAVSGISNSPGVRPQSIGNVDLKPERSIERELGAELGFFEDRASLDLTYYWQTTSDAILERRLPASEGFLEPQFVNIGELASNGLEAGLNAQVIQSPSFQLTMGGSFAWKNSEVTDLADVAQFKVSDNTNRWNYVKEGFEPGAVIGPIPDPQNPWELAVPVEEFDDLTQVASNTLKNAAGGDSLVFIGNQLPTQSASLSTTIDLPRDNLTFRMMWKGEAGFVMFDQTNHIRANTGITPRVARWTQELQDPSTSTARRREIADAWGQIHPNIQTTWVQDADYLKLQELSMTWTVPSSLSNKLSLSETSITLAGRSLLLFTKYGGMADPGTTTAGESDLIQNVDYYSAPVPPRLGLTIRTGF